MAFKVRRDGRAWKIVNGRETIRTGFASATAAHVACRLMNLPPTHYNKTDNGRPACEGYIQETIPDTEPTTKVLAEVTCEGCQELLETEFESDEDDNVLGEMCPECGQFSCICKDE